MRVFQNVEDLGDLKAALREAFEVKKNRFQYQELGRNKTALLIFFNNSLRTRLSTQKAAMNLGMNVIVLDVNQGAWKLETERGVIMDGDKSEHLLEAIPVMGCYCDLIGVRSFATFESRKDDYEEKILNQFIRYSGKPVFFMESATVHPLQSFADLITIEEYKRTARPKVVLSWAPHPKALPQAVPNSFAQWMNAADVDFVVTHPEGYELDPKFVGDARVEYDQLKAFEGADFIYAKNWSLSLIHICRCQELELSRCDPFGGLRKGVEQGHELDGGCCSHGCDEQRFFHALSARAPQYDCDGRCDRKPAVVGHPRGCQS